VVPLWSGPARPAIVRRAGAPPPRRAGVVDEPGGATQTWRRHGGRALSDHRPHGAAAEDLERELRFHRELVAASGEGIYRLDFEPPVPVDGPVAEQIAGILAGGRVAAANDALARARGYERGADLVGHSLTELLDGADPATRAALAVFVEAGYFCRDLDSFERDRQGRRRVFVNAASGVVESGRLVAAWGRQREVTAERDALEKLSASEALFTAAFQDSPAGLSLSKLEDGRFAAVSNSFLEWLDLTREEVIGRTATELGLWRDAAEREGFVSGLRRDGVVRHHRHRVVNRHGEQLELLLSARRLDVAGLPTILMTGENVTEIEKARRQLADSEHKFSLIFHANPGALALSRLSDSRFVDVNEAFADLVGVPREQLIGRSALEIGLWPDPEDRRRAFAPILEQGFARQVPARVSRVNGEIRSARISGTTLEVEGERCVLVLAEDVTELDRAQQALSESEARFRDAAEGSLDAFLLLEAVRDQSGRVVDFELTELNQVAARMTGRERHELLGGRLLERCPLHRQIALFERYREVFETRRPIENEVEVRQPGLRHRWLRQQVVPLERGVAIWARDVTTQRAEERERSRLESGFHRGQRLESLGLLAGGVAHDFNNLLTGILGYAEVAVRRLPSSSDALAPLQQIAQAAQRATELTQKMLAFAGGGPMRLSWISLNEVVEEMVELARPALPAGHRVALELGHPGPGLEADATQMRQVVLNLLLNASEAIEGEQGEIGLATGEVYCESSRLRAAELGAELAEGRYAFVRVTDDGVGMAPDVRERIFEPFFTTKFTGRGLGLAAVLGIVRAHAGAIEVESEPGRGTALTVLLPIAQPHP
jgi:PAS domain S-box-containing protein